MIVTGATLFKNFVMKKFGSVILCGCFYLAVSANDVSAQSSVVQLPGDFSRGAFSPSDGRQSLAVTAMFPPSSLSVRQLTWDSILAQAHPEIGEAEITTSQLLQQLRRLELPVLLDESARVDSLDENTEVRLELSNEPLSIRLDQALRMRNAVLAMMGDQLRIVSLDVASDPEYFLTTSYDVGVIGTDVQSLLDTIESAVDPDGWDDTNGDSSIESNSVNGQNIVTLSAPYSVHLQVRNFFNGLNRLSGGHEAQNYIAGLTTGRRGSQIVALPIPDVSNFENQRVDRKRGSGIGGFGGGGGVF